MFIEIQTPGSKSISNRYLALAALSNKEVKIDNIADCDDTVLMLNALKKCGYKVAEKENLVKVSPSKKSPNKVKLNTGSAGTTTRFFTAISTLLNKEIEIDGDKRMRERPIGILIKALNQLGAKIKSTKDNFVPLTVYPQKLLGGTITIKGDISSQYISALLMTCPFAEKKTTINISSKLCSKPYVDITLSCLKDFGIEVKNKNYEQFFCTPQKVLTQDSINLTVESDCSSASYIAAYASSHPGTKILLKNIHSNSIQGDIKFLDYIKKLGAEVKTSNKGIKILGPKKMKLLGKVDMNKTPDLVMTFAVLALITPGTTTLTNIENLRIKETDRLSALENEIKKLGFKVKTGKDYIQIENNEESIKKAKSNKKKVLIKTYNDHRMAMSFAVIKDIFKNIEIENPSCVSKSYTTFWQDLEKLQKNNQETQ